EPRREHASPHTSTPSPEQQRPTGDQGAPVESQGESTQSHAPAKNWSIGDDVLGQDAIIRRVIELLGVTETLADIDELEAQNAERIGRITGNPAASLRQAFRDRRNEFLK